MNIQSSKLFRAYRFITHLPENLHSLRADINNLQQTSQNLTSQLGQTEKDTEKSISNLGQDVEIIKQWQADMGSRVMANTQAVPAKRADKQQVASQHGLQADNHDLDGYYLAFENKFRGSEEDIYGRLKESYTDLLSKKLPKELRKMPVIDIGCGRGELLHLVKDLGLKGIGIDLNKAMVDRCKQIGYEAVQQDALDFLRQQPSSSLAAIGGIHIVEHIPFEQLLSLLKECYRTVAPGGFVFFETPNAENVVVGSLTFWYDSSHLKPIPPEALAFVLQYAGFAETEIMRMHPEKEIQAPAEGETGLLQEVANKMFGARDYAAIGIKRRAK